MVPNLLCEGGVGGGDSDEFRINCVGMGYRGGPGAHPQKSVVKTDLRIVSLKAV